jgi:hypothetical protein
MKGFMTAGRISPGWPTVQGPRKEDGAHITCSRGSWERRDKPAERKE